MGRKLHNEDNASWPGHHLSDETCEQIQEKHHNLLNPQRHHWPVIEDMLPWNNIALRSALSELNAEEKYFLLHRYPQDCEFLGDIDDGYEVSGDELKDFLQNRIIPGRCWGMDVSILPENFSYCLVFSNHADICRLD